MDNIPEMDDGRKKEEKRKGFLGWLRSKLGAGGRGAMGGAGEGGAGIGGRGAAGLGGRGAAGLGRTALGAAGRGASQGLFGGLLGGNLMSLIGYAVILAAVGAGFYYGTQGNSGAGTSSSSFSKGSGASYVPAIMRQKSGGSSLDIFREANKANLANTGADAAAGEGDVYDQDGYDKDGYDKDGYDRDGYDRNGYDRDGYDRDGYDKDGYDRNGFNRDGYDRSGNSRDAGAQAGGGSQAGSRLGNMFGSSSGDGGGGGSSTNWGRDPQGGSAGRGGSAAARAAAQRNKLLAMKGAAQAVTGSKAGARSQKGSGALGQTRAIRNVQTAQRSTYGSPDAMRSTQDTAWTGAGDTGKSIMGTGLTSGGRGSGSGGGAVSDGSSGSGGSGSGGYSSGGDDYSGSSSGVSSSGSSGSSGSGSGSDSGGDQTKNPVDVSPWAGLAASILKLVVLSTVLAIAGASIIKAVGWTGAGYYIGMAMCIAAAGLAVWAGVLAGQLMSQYGQMALGALYMAGAGLALAGALVAMFGSHVAATITMATWLGIAGGVCGLMGMFLGK